MSNILGLSTGLARLIQSTQKPTDPSFVQLKLSTQKQNLSLRVVTTACAINSVVFILFGFVGMVSTPIFLLALPLGYFSYNMYKMSLNAEEVIENLKTYRSAKAKNNLYTVEEKVLCKQLLKDTFHFELFGEVIVKHLSRARDALPT